jgi:hypothetical protein
MCLIPEASELGSAAQYSRARRDPGRVRFGPFSARDEGTGISRTPGRWCSTQSMFPGSWPNALRRNLLSSKTGCNRVV